MFGFCKRKFMTVVLPFLSVERIHLLKLQPKNAARLHEVCDVFTLISPSIFKLLI